MKIVNGQFQMFKVPEKQFQQERAKLFSKPAKQSFDSQLLVDLSYSSLDSPKPLVSSESSSSCSCQSCCRQSSDHDSISSVSINCMGEIRQQNNNANESKSVYSALQHE